MKQRRHELRQLSEMLEAEYEGRPFDRATAHRLAARLAEHVPAISQSMRLICERVATADGIAA